MGTTNGQTQRRGQYLKGDADVTTISIRDLFPNLALPRTTQDDSPARTFRHEARRFQVRLLQIDIPAIATDVRRADERSTLLCNLVHLQNLPLDDVIDDARDELDDFALPEARERGARPSEQEIAPEDGILVPKGSGCGRGPATQVRAVNYVVMQQGRHMYHLDDLREPCLRGQRRRIVGDHPQWSEASWRWGRCGLGRTWGDEGEDGGEGGGAVWHARIPVVQHVRTRERAVELLCTSTRAFAFSGPFFQLPVGPKTVGCAGEKEDEQWTELLGRVQEIIFGDVGESGVGGPKQI